jgi:hypothetical protein
MKEPAKRADGTCAACIGGWMCAYHSHVSEMEYRRRFAAIRLAADGAERAAIEALAYNRGCDLNHNEDGP